MGSLLEASLALEMERWEAAGLRRRLASESAGRVDFTSNDYLGLARHPEVIEAARAALARHGAGGRASRLLGGGCPLHEAAEEACAAWLSSEAALLFPSGYQANLGLVGALVGRGDVVISDRLVHASLIDAARLSRARVLVHAHLDLDELERRLGQTGGARRRLVLTEGVFSMDGDAPDLGRLDELCRRHDAWLIVDEAHSIGLSGPEGAGASASAGLDDADSALAARVITGGKALGVAGAFVVGSAALREHLVNHARSFVFSTAPSPAVAGALLAAIELCRAAELERAQVCAFAGELARRLGLSEPAAAIVPLTIGNAEDALALAGELSGKGFDVRAVRPPSVPEGGARLRVTCHAFNSEAEVDELARMLEGRGVRDGSEVAPAVDPRRALFVTGTDTGVGKTVVSALLLLAARRLGTAAYWKPVQTGKDDDTESVGALANAAPHELLRPAWTFELPASPHEAAAAAHHEIDPARLEEGLTGLLRTLPATSVVVELAGGVLVPYRLLPELVTQADWLERAGAGCVLVARSSIGTLNHTLLTLEALRARHVEPRALFLVGEPHPSNRDTLQRVAGVPLVFEVPPFERLGAAVLEAWLDENDLAPLFES